MATNLGQKPSQKTSTSVAYWVRHGVGKIMKNTNFSPGHVRLSREAAPKADKYPQREKHSEHLAVNFVSGLSPEFLIRERAGPTDALILRGHHS